LGLRTFINNVRDLARTKLANAEQRSAYPYSLVDGVLKSLSNLGVSGDGEPVITPLSAMRISTYFTCVLVRAESLASLPAHVCQYTSKGSVKAYNHPAHYLIHDRPNPFQTASDFWKTVSAHIDTQGEAIGIISWSGRWMPASITLVPDPSEVEISVSDGRPWFRYRGVLYEDWQVLHFKDLSLDGVRGCSKVRYNAETLGYASKLKGFGKQSIGTKPPGYFSTEAPYDTIKKQQEDISKGWKEQIVAGKTPVLPFGLKYNHLMISPGDAQYLDAIAATKEDIYGICRVPPTLAQNYERATFSNAEQQDLVFIKYTMLPLITNIEQECNSKLFSEANKTSSEPYYVKFNVSAFMRGDFRSQAEGFRTLFNCGLINGDTVADLMDWNKWEGGDRRFIQMNMMPIDRVDDVVDSLTAEKVSQENAPDAESKRSQPLEGFIYQYKKNGHPVNGHGQ
jgi:HK97 family phage portal protein